MKTFNFSEAMKRIDDGKKVSCTRWGTNGNVEVFYKEVDIQHEGLMKDFRVLLLHDKSRHILVTFTPSNENMLDDEWYEIEVPSLDSNDTSLSSITTKYF